MHFSRQGYFLGNRQTSPFEATKKIPPGYCTYLTRALVKVDI